MTNSRLFGRVAIRRRWAGFLARTAALPASLERLNRRDILTGDEVLEVGKTGRLVDKNFEL